MNEDLKFFSKFHRHPRSIGAIMPSSRELAEVMMEPIDFNKASVVVELGVGTGALVAELLKKLSLRTKYIGVEKNGDFFRTLKERFPNLDFVHDSAENIADILRAAGIDNGADVIICGLPWTTLPLEQEKTILKAIKQSLRPGGVLVTFAYVPSMLFPAAWAFRRRLEADFASVETTRVVWRNVPPAFAYVCRR